VENYAAPAAIPSHFVSAPLPVAEAIARLENTIAEWCRDAFASNNVGAPPQLGVRATAGLGKTRKLLQILVENPNANKRNIDVYVPQHRLADELAFEHDTIMSNISFDSRRRLRVQVIRGREHVGHSGTAMCAKAEIAGQIARAGHEVWGHLCERRRQDGNIERCEHYRSCPYVAQFQDTSPAVRIMTHDYLFITRSTRLPRPDAVVVDESFHAKTVRVTSFAIDRLTSRPCRRFDAHIENADLAELDRIARLVRKAIETGAHPRDLGITIDHCRFAARKGAAEVERNRAANRLSDVQFLVDVEAARGGRVLLVTYKPVAAQIKVPTGCAVDWFGNIRGLDSYKTFDCIIIAGREQPPVQSVEDMVRALFGDGPLPELSGILSEAVRGYRICNGGR
jgi:hypothetical protein